MFAFEKVCVPNAVRSNINASHVRLGFVSNDPSHMVEQLNAAVKHLGSHARDDSWTLPRHEKGKSMKQQGIGFHER